MIKAIAFQIGPLAIHWYSLMILSAIVVGTSLGRYHAERAGEDPEHVYNIALYGALAGILGARAYYVALCWDFYKTRPAEILATWHGGLAIHGGIIGALLALFLYARKHRLGFWKYLDLLCPGLVLGQGIGRWGNFFNNEAYGSLASWPTWWHWHFGNPDFLPWGIQIPASFRTPEYADLLRFPETTALFHPTFLYESLWNVGVFTVLLFLMRRSGLPKGTVFFSYLLLYSLGRFFIEGLRTDSLMLFGALRMAQVVSLSLIAGSLAVLATRFFLCYTQEASSSPSEAA